MAAPHHPAPALVVTPPAVAPLPHAVMFRFSSGGVRLSAGDHDVAIFATDPQLIGLVLTMQRYPTVEDFLDALRITCDGPADRPAFVIDTVAGHLQLGEHYLPLSTATAAWLYRFCRDLAELALARLFTEGAGAAFATQQALVINTSDPQAIQKLLGAIDVRRRPSSP
jgi:hypothetical protein